jgi:proteic killer suppression protein
MAIQSFENKQVEDFFYEGKIDRRAGWREQAKVAARKLDMLNSAEQLEDLRVPPGNRLEALSGDYEGFYSVRVNQQWRLVFLWGEEGPERVDIVDYH